MMPNPDDDKEEGEIEDGEIIESGEERDRDEDDRKSGNEGTLSMMELLYMEMEGKGDMSLKKKKKKRKKRKKSGPSSSREINERGGNQVPNDGTNPPKPKMPRYIDHDRVAEGNNGSWQKPFQFGQQAGPVPPTVIYNWSPERSSPDENNPYSKNCREKSPPGLYDSPYESEDDADDGGGGGGGAPGNDVFPQTGYFERDFHGGSGRQGNNRKNRKRKGRSEKRGGVKNRDGNDNRRRNQRPLLNSDTQHLICKFYLEGKCSKGEGCNYSHDISNKKMELCKFYLNGFCSKIESCIYLHNEFPCKFYHTGAQCYSAENCKFSHDVLTEEMRKALDYHLTKDNKTSGSPSRTDDCSIQPRPHRPSLLGSPPQHIKDMVMKKKIPSLFDLEIKPPVYQAGVGTGTGTGAAPGPGPNMPHPPAPTGQGGSFPPPMGPPPGHGPLLPTPNDFRQNACDDMRNSDSFRAPLLPLPTSSFDPDPQDFYAFDQDLRNPFNNKMDPSFTNAAQQFNPPKRFFGTESSMMDIDERYLPNSAKINNSDMYKMSNFDEDERVHEIIKNSDNTTNSSHENHSFNPIPWRNLAVSDVDMRSSLKDDESSNSSSANKDFYSKNEKGSNSNEEPFGAGLDTSTSSDSDDENKISSKSNQQSSTAIPLHLPKKQRELFMRIQQREAANKTTPDSEDSKKPDDNAAVEMGVSGTVADTHPVAIEENKEAEKERWYSSSEDDDDDNDQPLAAMLKQLQQQPLSKPTSAVSMVSSIPSVTQPSTASNNDSSIFQLSKILQSITSKTTNSSSSVPSAPSSSVKVDPRRDPRRDPRSSRSVPPTSTSTVELRDPRSKLNRPLLPTTQPQQSTHQNTSFTNTVSYIDHFSSSSSPRAGETQSQNSSTKSSVSPRLPEPSKPQPILARKRSSASEEEIVEISHSTSSSATSHNPIPYKLRSISVSLPNYSSVVHSVNKTVDPKLLLCDPRLKKELANEFSVLNSGNETSTSSSLSSQSKNGSRDGSGTQAANKVRVGQHRLGVATMPAPRMKPQSSQLKKPSGSLLLTPLSLLREPPERSTTPPSLLFSTTKAKDVVSTKEETDNEGVKELKAYEQPSILSPNAEPVKFDYQIKSELEIINEEKEVVSDENKDEQKAKSVVIDSSAVVELVKSTTPPPPPPRSSIETMDFETVNKINNFDDDDVENEMSDSDMVIVEPELEKVKKVKKIAKPEKKVTTKPAAKESGDKKSIFMVAQVGDGTCIKIKMIKPTKQQSKVNDKPTAESKKEPKSKSANGKHSATSFEDALTANIEQKNSKKPKKRQQEEKKNKSVRTKSKVAKSKHPSSSEDAKTDEIVGN